MRRHLTRLFGAAIIAIVGVFGVGDGEAASPKKGGTLIMLVKPEPNQLASYLSTAGPVGQVADKVYDGLVEYDFDLNPIPGLATSWEISKDGKTITFKLRKGVKFHDGTPFTSADVAFSILGVLKNTHPRAPLTFRDLSAIDTPDEHTAVFRLERPAPYLMAALAGHETPIVSKKHFEGTDLRANPTANKPIGTGPFKFIEWKRGQYIRFDRNEDYWKEGLPYLDRIVTRFIPDASTRTAAIETGEVHYAAFNAIPNVDAKRLAEIPGITVTTKGYEMINPLMMMEINIKVPPFDKKEVRQAVAYALDRQFIVDNIFFGFGKPATGALSSNFGLKGLYTDDVRKYGVADRIGKANELLDKAGYPRKADGYRMEITHEILPYGETWQRLGEYVKQALDKVGIKVKLRHEDPAPWLKRIYTNYDFQISPTFFYQFADPVIGVHRQYLTSQIRKGTVFVNSSRFSDPVIDDLLEKATYENDKNARIALYHKAQRILADELPVIPLFEMEFITVYSNKVKNAVTSPLGVYTSFDRVWLDQ